MGKNAEFIGEYLPDWRCPLMEGSAVEIVYQGYRALVRWERTRPDLAKVVRVIPMYPTETLKEHLVEGPLAEAIFQEMLRAYKASGQTQQSDRKDDLGLY